MGAGLWIPFAVPSVGVLCSRAWWEASSESPWVFGDASHLHDLKRLCLFRRDEVPARNTDRPSGFAFTPRKKFLRVPRGVFSKTRPWQGVGQRPTKGGRASPNGARLFSRDKVLSRNTPRLSGFAFTHLKKFLRVPRDAFSKTRTWQGCGTESHRRKERHNGLSIDRNEKKEYNPGGISEKESEEKRDGQSTSCRPFAAKELV